MWWLLQLTLRLGFEEAKSEVASRLSSLLYCPSMNIP